MIRQDVTIKTIPEVIQLAVSPDEQGFANSYVSYIQFESEDEENPINEVMVSIPDVNLRFVQGSIPAILTDFMEVDIIFPKGKVDVMNRLMSLFEERDKALLEGRNIFSHITITPHLLNGEAHLIFEDMFMYALSALDSESGVRVLKMLFFDDNYGLLTSDDFNEESVDADLRREEMIEEQTWKENSWDGGENEEWEEGEAYE